MPPILNPASPWQPERSEYVFLWHGCTELDRDDIEANGIDLTRGQVDTDFGRGFYTTTIERQARQWAWTRYRLWQTVPEKAGIRNRPVVLRFRAPRYGGKGRPAGLDELRSLHFVLGIYDNEDYWSLVQHCRQSKRGDPALGQAEVVRDHQRPPDGWYDLVTGPVAAFWEQRVAMQDADQVSFHTPTAVKILNNLIQSKRNGNLDDYRGIVLPELT